MPRVGRWKIRGVRNLNSGQQSLRIFDPLAAPGTR